MKKLNLREKLDFVKGLYETWLSREEELKESIYPVERLTGNIEVLSELLEQDFKDDEDMKRKVESWIEEREEKLRTQTERTEKYFKRKFEKDLKESCLSRHKRRKKK